MDPPISSRPSITDRYRFDEVIGRGGMGTVWKATDLLLGRTVAIKDVLLPPHASADERHSARARLMREAHAAARVSDPAVVTVHDVIDEHERLFLVMEHVNAPSLEELVIERGPLPPDEVAAIGARIAGALASAQSLGVVHRDVKPSNVLIPDGGSSAKLVDFGIAALADSPGLTAAGFVMGSPSYMSPEQAEGGSATTTSDVFSLAATLYFAVEGDGPFQRENTMATLAAVASQPPRTPQRAGALGPVLHSMMEKDPQRRPPIDVAQRRLAELTKPAMPAAPSAASTTTAAPTTTEAPSTTAPVTVPAGFVEYTDPQGGFVIAVPEGMAVTLDDVNHTTELTSGESRIAVRWFGPPVDPLDFLNSERDRLSGFPRYRELVFEAQPFREFPGGFWEFEFAQSNNPDLLLHSTGRVFTVGTGDDEVTYAVFFRGPADGFDDLEADQFSVSEESFEPLFG